MKSAMRHTVFLFALILAMIPLSGEAVIIPQITETVSLQVTPKYPKPGDQMIFNVHSSGNADSFSYVWEVNGKTVAQGAGIISITIPAGDVGSRATVSVRLIGSNGLTQGAASRSIKPADVDIVWEGKTYVPPLYEGRPLTNASSRLTLLAIPFFGSAVSPSGLTYTWEIDGRVLNNQSGRGKESVEITPPLFNNPFTATVRATSVDGSIIAEKSITISPVVPFAVLYQYSPLSGITFNRAASGVIPFKESEVAFNAYPFFVSDPDALSYEWNINGTPFINDTAPRSITLRKENANDAGIYAIRIAFKNVVKAFESGAGAFNLEI